MYVLAFSVSTKVTEKVGEKLKKRKKKKHFKEISHLPTFNTHSLAKPENEKKIGVQVRIQKRDIPSSFGAVFSNTIMIQWCNICWLAESLRAIVLQECVEKSFL